EPSRPAPPRRHPGSHGRVRRRACAAWHRPDGRARRGGRARGRIRLRQVGDLARRARSPAAEGEGRWQRAARRGRTARGARAGARRRARRARRDDFPGPRERAEPGAAPRPASRGGARSSSRPVERRDPGGGQAAVRSRRHSGQRAPSRRLPARTLGRPEPTRHDRHGPRGRARPARRRRADDRARHHHPGPDPGSSGPDQAGHRHGAGADQPRSRRHFADLRSGLRHVCRPHRRGGLGRRVVRGAASSLCPGTARRLAHARRRAAAARPDPGLCPGTLESPARLPLRAALPEACLGLRRRRPGARPQDAGSARSLHPRLRGRGAPAGARLRM
ncbi:MAG: ABC transporter, ATP-binding protein (cluster 5, nickel/peptides/opines), partial [uncultured Microvirga sp.]